MGPEQIFLDSLDWLWRNYGDYSFFAERDVVWTLQNQIRDSLTRNASPFRVFHGYPMTKGKRMNADLALVDPQGKVELAAEFKYEPDPARGRLDGDVWPTKLPAVFWSGRGSVVEDAQRVHQFVDEGVTPVAYSVFVDEGGRFRTREEPGGARWREQKCLGKAPRSVWVLAGRASTIPGRTR